MRIDWHGYKGFRQLRMSTGALAMCVEQAEGVAGRANIDGGRSEYEASGRIGKNRARASVITANPAAIVENLKHDTLLRALGGGGG